MKKLQDSIRTVLSEACGSKKGDAKKKMIKKEAFDSDTREFDGRMEMSHYAKEIIANWNLIDAQDAEDIFMTLSDWYTDKADDLTNINCKEIAKLLKSAALTMNDRTGN